MSLRFISFKKLPEYVRNSITIPYEDKRFLNAYGMKITNRKSLLLPFDYDLWGSAIDYMRENFLSEYIAMQELIISQVFILLILCVKL